MWRKFTVFTANAENHAIHGLRDFVNFYCPYSYVVIYIVYSSCFGFNFCFLSFESLSSRPSSSVVAAASIVKFIYSIIHSLIRPFIHCSLHHTIIRPTCAHIFSAHVDLYNHMCH